MVWSQDGTKLLVSGPVAQEKQGIWMIGVIGATLKKLRDDAHDADLSPDGTQIVYRDAVKHGIWIMGVDGGNARELFKLDPGMHVNGPTWFKNGKRILYDRFWDENGLSRQVLESRDVQGGDPVPLLKRDRLIDNTFAQSGRLIYSEREQPPAQYDANLWEQYFDAESGKPNGAPRRLTDWTGFYFGSPQVTADGKRLVFLNGIAQSDVYLGELAAGSAELKSPQRLTLDDRVDWPSGWSPDSKTIYFYSDKSGTFDLYKQGVAERNATTVVSGPEEKWAPQLSPDGKWILYLQWPKVAPGAPPGQGKLMRMPVGGGPAEVVSDVKGHPGQLNNYDPTNSIGGVPSFRCVEHSATCVLAEAGGDDQVVFTAIDPVQGRKAELTKAAVVPDLIAWDLSPDASRVVISTFDYKAGDVQIVPLAGGGPQKLSAMPWTDLVAVAWAADGKSLLLASYSSRGTAIVRMDAKGGTPVKLLKQPSWDVFALVPSPDGHTLAFGTVTNNANVWTIADFPAK
jgi:Tol biopolymer transport system component